MKEAYYFPHDTNACQDPKMMRLILAHGLMGVGLYWSVIELLHQQPDGRIAADDLDASLEFYAEFERDGQGERVDLRPMKDELVRVGLLSAADGVYFSERVLRNKEDRSEKIDARREAGRAGGKASAAVRWGKKVTDSNDCLTTCNEQVTVLSKGKERKGKERKEKKREEYTECFEQFWAAYPNKTGKGAAFKAWGKANPDLATCLTALAWQAKQPQWVKDGGRFIPHPSTWLNGARWADERVLVAGSGAAPIQGKYDGIEEVF